jgi:subfamily B ATP-binding cassette protein MsbA
LLRDAAPFLVLVRGRRAAVVGLLSMAAAEAALDGLSLGLVAPLLAAALGNGPGGTPFHGLPAGKLTLGAAAALIACAFVVKNAVKYASDYLQASFLWDLRRTWWERILSGYLESPYARFTRERHGALLSDLINEPTQCVKAFKLALGLIGAACTCAACYAALAWVSWKTTAVMTLAGAVLFGGLRRVLASASERLGHIRLEKYRQVTQQATEALNGVLQIKVFSLEQRVLREFGRTLAELNRELAAFEALRNLPGPLAEAAAALLLSGTLVYLSASGASVAGSLPAIAAFVLLAQRLLSQSAALMSSNADLRSLLPAVRRVAELCDGGGAEEEAGRLAPPPGPWTIRLRGVTFAYPGSEPCLAGVSLELPAGTVTALVGASGAGKTTLCNILGGIYRGYSGRILVGDAELRDIRVDAWRRRIAYISQDNHIFSGTVAENIHVGRSDADSEAVRRAAAAVNANEFIERLPDGYETHIGDRGLRLSGGQRQRLVLARAVLRQPDLYIFDEPTTALDVETRAELGRLVKRLSRESGKAVLVISHDAAWVGMADRSYALEHGAVRLRDAVEPEAERGAAA